ncbi:tRNA(Met) cytidine acetyltransferase TmcA [compost metagenome]
MLVRIGGHREASSGCYTAMAMLPLSEAGRALCQREHQRLCRDASIIEYWNGEKIPVAAGGESTLNDDDWLELAGFAFAHRPFSAAVASLTRLLLATSLPLAGLRGKIESGLDDAALSRVLKLSGRKALLAHLRSETGAALAQHDDERARQLQSTILQWQFFQ